ncbi:hypothetical protein [Thermotoga profunda]|nr:hypothetical protein [Thermotoga profunda]
MQYKIHYIALVALSEQYGINFSSFFVTTIYAFYLNHIRYLDVEA